MDIAIYTRSDGRYFPGLVALLGSLQRLGVDHPVYLVDTGLTDAQRRYVANLADVRVARPSIDHYRLDGSKVARYNSTVFAGLEVQFPHHDVLVHLDGDAVVLGSLDPLVEAAADHGFAATGEIPPSNLGTHFWGMPTGTGRALQDVSRADQERAFRLMGKPPRSTPTRSRSTPGYGPPGWTTSPRSSLHASLVTLPCTARSGAWNRRC